MPRNRFATRTVEQFPAVSTATWKSPSSGSREPSLGEVSWLVTENMEVVLDPVDCGKFTFEIAENAAHVCEELRSDCGSQISAAVVGAINDVRA